MQTCYALSLYVILSIFFSLSVCVYSKRTFFVFARKALLLSLNHPCWWESQNTKQLLEQQIWPIFAEGFCCLSIWRLPREFKSHNRKFHVQLPPRILILRKNIKTLLKTLCRRTYMYMGQVYYTWNQQRMTLAHVGFWKHVAVIKPTEIWDI